MNIGNAVAIFGNINSNDYSDEEKALAIYEVLNMPTHMSIKKDSMLTVIKWLWDRNYEMVGETNDT